MKVVLIRPKTENTANTERPASIMRSEGMFPPLGLAYIAAFLEREGYAVSIVDGEAEGKGNADVAAKLLETKADIAGISSTTPELPNAIALCEMMKKADESVITVVGGAHLSCFPKETVGFDCIDFGIRGEGEHAFAELAAAIEKRSADFSKIKGLVWKKNEQVVMNPQRKPLEELDTLPFPARRLLPLNRYHALLMGQPMTSIIAARGCPYNCAYCFRDPTTSRHRSREPAKVVDEIEECIDTHGIREFSFLDDCWPKKHLLSAICGEITSRRLDIRWNIRQRADLAGQEVLRKMKRAGCTFIKYGVESGSERILKLMHKGTRKNVVKNSFASTRKAGIATFGYFMTGYPTETKEDFQATLELAKELSPDWAMFNATIPFPNTELLEFAIKKCGFDSKYWQKWATGECKKTADPMLREAGKRCIRAYKEFYFRPEYAIQKLKDIRSFRELIKYGKGAMAIASTKTK